VGRREVALPVLGGDADASTGAGAGPPQPRAGMGVVFDQGHPESQEAGGPLFAVEPVSTSGGAAGPADAAATRWWLRFGEPGPDLRRVAVGDRVWLTGDPGIERRVRKLTEQPVTGRLPIQLRVRGAAGTPLSVEAVGRRLRAEGQSTAPLTPAAAGGGLTEALLLDKLGAFGGTAFTLLDLDASGLEAGLHLPVSQLKALRRDLVAALDAQQAAGVDRAIDPRPALPRLHAQAAALLAARAAASGAPTVGAPIAAAASPSDPLDRRPPELLPLCRTEAQLDAVIAAGLPLVELDWMERAGLTLAVARARAAGLRVHIATPRVQKPGEEGFDKRIARLSPDGVLVRHWGALMHFLEHPEDQRPALHGDFSLNVTNALTAAHLLSLGLDTLTAAHDLDAAQLLALLATVPGAAGTLTVALHHHIPTFHTEHCVYAHLLSNGRDISSCGQPCQNHEIGLRDHLGNVHPVVVDPACRNTVYNAAAQSAASLVPQLRAAGVRRFRVEFVREGVEETARVLAAYQGLLAGHLSPSQVFERLRVHEQFGVSRGTMRVER
jgi:putative protease